MERAPGSKPYVGLRPFSKEDSLFFFGRGEQTSELLETLHHERFVAVMGSSGCGKSSLVHAGLIPKLSGGFLEGRQEWLIVSVRPGDAPFANLARALCDALAEPGLDVSDVEHAIRRRQAEAVLDLISEHAPAGTSTLLLLDQFEELFAFRGTEEEGEEERDLGPDKRRERARRRVESDRFVDVILQLREQRDTAIFVVLTMRTDFLGHCDLFYGLPEAMNQGRYLVPRLTRSQLRQAIEGPAMLMGSEIAPRLLDRVLNEVGDRYDQLPVLQHALLRTWEEWTAEGVAAPIDHEHFDRAGGLSDALSREAELALGVIELRPGTSGASDVAFSADGQRLLTVSEEGPPRLWDSEVGSELAVLDGHAGRVYHAEFSADGLRVVTTGKDGTARLWDAITGEQVAVLAGHDGRVLRAAFGPDDRRVATAGGDETVRIWDLHESTPDGQARSVVLRRHGAAVRHVSFGPDGTRLLSADADGILHLWEVSDSPRHLARLSSQGRVHPRSFSPDGTRVVTAGPGNAVFVWGAETGAELLLLNGHEDAVCHASFSPDGSFLITGAEDHSARVWDASTGAMVGALIGHRARVLSAVFDARSHRMATGAADGSARLWTREAFDIPVTAEVFKALTDTDGHLRRVRRPARMGDLAAVTGDASAVQRVVHRFSEQDRHFLHVSDSKDPAERRVDISHESLIRQWGRLRGWVDEERRSRDRFLDLVARARQYNRGEASLLREPELSLARRWEETTQPTPAWADRYTRGSSDLADALSYLKQSKAFTDQTRGAEVRATEARWRDSSLVGLRRAVGLVGVLLPTVLALGCFASVACTGLQSAIGDYYGTEMRDILLGGLFCLAWCLFLHRGYARRDDVAGDVACLFALGMALFPKTHPSAAVVGVHLVSEVGLGGVMAFISLAVFTKAPGPSPTSPTAARNRVHRAAGYTLLACTVVGILCYALGGIVPSTVQLIFWLESLAFLSFGVSWLVKGDVVLRDAPRGALNAPPAPSGR